MQYNAKFGIAILFWQKKVPLSQSSFLEASYTLIWDYIFPFLAAPPHQMLLLNYIESDINCPTVIIWRNTTEIYREHSTESKGRLPTENVGLCPWNVVGHLLAPLTCNCCNSWPCGCTCRIQPEPEFEIRCSLRCLNLEFVSSVLLSFEFFGGFFVCFLILEWLSPDCYWYSCIMLHVPCVRYRHPIIPHHSTFFPNTLSS